MKYIYTLLFSFIFSVSSAFSQTEKPAPSMNYYAGYGIGLSATRTYADASNNITYFSFGSGFSAGVSYLHMLTNNIGIDAGASLLYGNSMKTKSQSNNFFSNAFMFRLAPSFYIQGSSKKFTPYARMGFVFGSAVVLRKYKAFTEPEKNKIVWMDSGGFSLGIRSSVGVGMSLANGKVLFAELDAIGLGVSPKKSTLIVAITNGENTLSEIDESYKEIIYVENYSAVNLDPVNGEPIKAIKPKYPFSSVGLNVGISVPLGGKK